MGEEVDRVEFTRADRAAFRHQVHRSLDTFAQMLRESRFDAERPMTGMEIELNLVDEQCDPAMRNAEVLSAIADPRSRPSWASSTSRSTCRRAAVDGIGLARWSTSMRASLNAAEEKAAPASARTMVDGRDPADAAPEHIRREALSANPRYALLNEQIFAARGEDLQIRDRRRRAAAGDRRHDRARGRLHQRRSSTCRSRPATFAALLERGPGDRRRPGRARRELAVPVRPGAVARDPDPAVRAGHRHPAARRSRPRAYGRGCGSANAGSPRCSTCSRRTSRYFPALLPIIDDEDPAEVLDRGDTPDLGELRLHNGTIYRWNRPVYDVVDGRPAPAGGEPGAAGRPDGRRHRSPTAPSTSDWSGRWPRTNGRSGRRCRSARPRRTSTPAARHGIDAQVFWPGLGTVPATELVLQRLLPLARRGLDAWGVDAAVRDRLLGIIEQRCLTDRNGASWQAESSTDCIQGIARTAGRVARDAAALPRHMHENTPVHEWPVD